MRYKFSGTFEYLGTNNEPISQKLIGNMSQSIDGYHEGRVSYNGNNLPLEATFYEDKLLVKLLSDNPKYPKFTATLQRRSDEEFNFEGKGKNLVAIVQEKIRSESSQEETQVFKGEYQEGTIYLTLTPITSSS